MRSLKKAETLKQAVQLPTSKGSLVCLGNTRAFTSQSYYSYSNYSY